MHKIGIATAKSSGLRRCLSCRRHQLLHRRDDPRGTVEDKDRDRWRNREGRQDIYEKTPLTRKYFQKRETAVVSPVDLVPETCWKSPRRRSETADCIACGSASRSFSQFIHHRSKEKPNATKDDSTPGECVRSGAWCIATSRSRPPAPLFLRGCGTGTACPCTCARLGP